MRTRVPSRRNFLRASGVALALPMVNSLRPRSAWAKDDARPAVRRLVTICTSLGVHAPFLFPEATGTNYELTPYLQPLADYRQDFTLLSGLSHANQSGKDGHSSGQTWLTAAEHPGLTGFVNSVSIDQLLAEKIGLETRYPSLQLSTSGNSQSFTRSGVMLQGERSPARMFTKLFVEGTEQEREQQMQRLRDGGSILDVVQEEAKRLGRRVAKQDRQTLAEYYESVREAERRLQVAQEWVEKPKPSVESSVPADVEDQRDIIGQMELLLELVPLIVQTDTTRLITVLIDGRNDVPPIPGVSIDHHNLSHHGKDEEKIKQLKLIETAEFETLGRLFKSMSSKQEGPNRLLDNTSILFGSNLGNANSHDTRNLPILLAGGGFKHGHYLAHDSENNTPLSNLFLQIAQRMELPLAQFGSSTSSSVDGLGS